MEMNNYNTFSASYEEYKRKHEEYIRNVEELIKRLEAPRHEELKLEMQSREDETNNRAQLSEEQQLKVAPEIEVLCELPVQTVNALKVFDEIPPRSESDSGLVNDVLNNYEVPTRQSYDPGIEVEVAALFDDDSDLSGFGSEIEELEELDMDRKVKLVEEAKVSRDADNEFHFYGHQDTARVEVTLLIVFLIDSFNLCSDHLLSSQIVAGWYYDMVTCPTGIGTLLENIEVVGIFLKVICNYGGEFNEKKWFHLNYNNLGDKVDLHDVGNRVYTVLQVNGHVHSHIKGDRSGDDEKSVSLNRDGVNGTIMFAKAVIDLSGSYVFLTMMNVLSKCDQMKMWYSEIVKGRGSILVTEKVKKVSVLLQFSLKLRGSEACLLEEWTKSVNLVHIQQDLVDGSHALLNHVYAQQEYERTTNCLKWAGEQEKTVTGKWSNELNTAILNAHKCLEDCKYAKSLFEEWWEQTTSTAIDWVKVYGNFTKEHPYRLQHKVWIIAWKLSSVHFSVTEGTQTARTDRDASGSLLSIIFKTREPWRGCFRVDIKFYLYGKTEDDDDDNDDLPEAACLIYSSRDIYYEIIEDNDRFKNWAVDTNHLWTWANLKAQFVFGHI